MFDFFDIDFSALFDGEGILDGLGWLGDIFGPGNSSALGDILAEGRAFGGIAEGRGVWESFEWLTNRMFEYQIWTDAFGHTGNYQSFKTSHATEELSHIREVMLAHGFILNQLRTHQKQEGIGPLLQEYEALGAHLPSSTLLKQVHRQLSKVVHESGSAPSAEHWSKLNSAKDALCLPDKCAAYEQALQRNGEKINEWFTKVAGGEWESMRTKFEQQARKRIAHHQAVPEGAAKWFSELSPAAKGGLVFATVVGVSAGVYGLARAFDKKHATQQDAEWRSKVHPQQEAAPAAAIWR